MPTRSTKRYAMTALENPQTTLTVAEESPRPDGFAKGLWKAHPMTPLTKCGTAFTAKTPAKKYDTSHNQFIMQRSSVQATK